MKNGEIEENYFNLEWIKLFAIKGVTRLKNKQYNSSTYFLGSTFTPMLAKLNTEDFQI
jgi:hypothetical protein